MQFPGELKSAVAGPARASGHAQRVGYVEGTIPQADVTVLVGLFPDVVFESVGSSWPERYAKDLDILIVGLDAASGRQIENATDFLKARPSRLQILVMLRNADVASSRALTRAGAADVIPLPATEAALALGLERLLARDLHDHPARKPGQVVAMLKAGGGVGATSLAVQAAYLLAARSGETANVCFADLDMQFGAAAIYFDLSGALTVTDCVAVGEVLQETQFATALAAHKSGVRVLAAPGEVTPLDTITPKLVDGLVGGLRRDFALTILDLPSVWTAWTARALQLVDRIVVVTQLSVAHVHLVRRQLAILTLQKLESVPLTLACNAVTAEQQNLLDIKAAERAIGRPFDILLPEDVRAMVGATNQGLPLASVKRGTKLEKCVGQLADRIAADAMAAPAIRR